MFQKTVNLEILEETLHDSVAGYGNSVLTDAFANANVNSSTGCILFLSSYVIALLRYVNGTGTVAYFLFHSHCRNSRGITD